MLAMVDDVRIASGDEVPRHRVYVRAAFDRLARRHYAAKPIKANILNVNIEYLGHISTPEGLKPPGAGVKHQLHKAQRTRRNKGVLPTRRRREI